MDADEYLAEVARLWPQSGQTPTKGLVDLCVKATDEHPESSALWYSLGIIMQRCSDDYGYGVNDFVRCFQNAIACDATNAEAHQELGYVLDVYTDEWDKAEKALKKAIELGAGWESYYAWARVLAEMGKIRYALDRLAESHCPYSDHSEIQKLRRELLDGIWGHEGNENERKTGQGK